MAYTPTEWVTGDVITAVKLNKAEQGIAANSNLVYYAEGEVAVGSEPVVTEGDFEEACAVIAAGGIVVLSITVAGVAGLYFSCNYTAGTPEIDLFSVGVSGSSLTLRGIKWDSDGLGAWPLV